MYSPLLLFHFSFPIMLKDLIVLTRKLYAYFGDLVKDIFFVIALGYLIQGGGSPLFWVLLYLDFEKIWTCNMNSTSFQMFYSMIGCIAIPYCLAVINHANSFELFTSHFMNILLLPLTPFLLIIIERRTLLELSNCTMDKFEKLLNYYLKLKIETARFIRSELCIESSLQITFGIVIIVFSRSKTRTAQGLEGMLDEGNDLIFGILPDIILTVSIVLSVITAWRSYVKGISQTKEHFPFKSKGILILYVIVSLAIKIAASLILLTPSLGLFNTLTHFQGELMPYWTAMGGPRADEHFPNVSVFSFNVTVESDIVYYSNVTPFAWTELTHFDYSDPLNPKEPPLTIYTYFSTETCLVGFWLIILCQAVIILVTKIFTNRKAMKKETWMYLFTHSLECTQLPSPLYDWDDDHGPI